MTDFEQQLASLENTVNQALDVVIKLRDSEEVAFLKNKYRKIGRRLERALDGVHAAQELMEG